MSGLSDYPVAPVLRVEDMQRARRFYADALGLKEVDDAIGAGQVSFQAGDGSMVWLYERSGLPAPENTAVGFGVPAEKFAEVMDDLRGRGVVFEEYDIPEMDLKTVDGVAGSGDDKIAWFKDTEGNILAIST